MCGVIAMVFVGIALAYAFGGWGVFVIAVFFVSSVLQNIAIAIAPGAMEHNPRECYNQSMFFVASLISTIAAIITWQANS